MRGVLLCGGEGTRLRPLTEVVNKHLIRVGPRPMAEYPLLKMIKAGITEIMIVTGGENFAGVVKYFGSGKRHGVKIYYAIQDEPGGIAQALSLARIFAGKEKILVCLGDNIWQHDITPNVKLFEYPGRSCFLFKTFSTNPDRFGTFKNDESGQEADIIEKPKIFISNWVVPGIYMYTPHVFVLIDELKPSDRGELEISDVNRWYLREGLATVLDLPGWWSDCGTIESIIQAENFLNDQ